MARTAITVTATTRSGVAQPSTQNGDATNNMYLPGNEGSNIVIEVYNAHASTTFTLGAALAQALVDGISVPDKQISIAALATKLFGPFPVGKYNVVEQTFPNCVLINVDAGSGTNLKLRAYKLDAT